MNVNVKSPLRRALAMLLCVAMLMSIVAVPVGAADTESQDATGSSAEETHGIEGAEVTNPTEADNSSESDTMVEPTSEANESMALEEISVAAESNTSVQLLADDSASVVSPKSDDIETFTTDAIRFNLFNYSNHINKVLKSDNTYAWDPIIQYFTFRGGTSHHNIDPNADADSYGRPAMSPNNATTTDSSGTTTISSYPQALLNGSLVDVYGISTGSGYNTTVDTDGYTATHATLKNTLDENGNPSLDLQYDSLNNIRSWTYDGTNKDLFKDTDYYSLAYLFDPDTTHHAVTAYEANNLLLIEVEGDTYHYYYNSKDNAVDYDTVNNLFYVRNYVERTSSTASYDDFYDFLPFTYTDGVALKTVTENGVTTTSVPVTTEAGTAVKISDDKEAADENNYYSVDSYENDYWFGMTMEVDFYMTKDGMLTEDGELIPMEFFFSGDDDVWVFVDNVLVLDLGGTHGTVDGSINFATGEVKQYLSWSRSSIANSTNKIVQAAWQKYINEGGSLTKVVTDETTGAITGTDYAPLWDTNGTLNSKATSFPTDLKTRFEEANATPNGGWDEDGITFADYTKHTLKFFYLERGSAVANCKLDFRLPVLPNNALLVTKDITVDGTKGDEADIIQNSLSYGFRVWKTDADGNRTDELFIKPYTDFDILDGSLNDIGDGTVGADGIFYLKAGETAQFLDMLKQAGGYKTYVVEEILPTDLRGQYGSVEYTVGSTTQNTVEHDNGDTETFYSFFSGVLSAESSQAVTYKNKVVVENLSTLKITKTAEGDVDPNKEFSIQVKLGGELLPAGTAYTVNGESKTVNIPGIIPLKVGETAILQNKILSGTEFEVTEILTTGEKFAVTYSGTITDKDAVSTALTPNGGISGTFSLSSTAEVTVQNKNVPVVVEIPLSKTAMGNTQNTSFTFVANRIKGKEDRTVLVANDGNAKIDVANGDVESGVIRLAYDGNTSTGCYYYEIYEVDGTGNFIYDTNYYIVEVTINHDAQGSLAGGVTGIWLNGSGDTLGTASFVNQKLANIIVHKDVQGVASDTDFGFSMYFGTSSPNNDSTVTSAEAFFLNDNGSYALLTKIPVGSDIVISEDSVEGYATYCKVGTNGTYAKGTEAVIENVADGTTHVYFVNAKYTVDDTVVIDYGLPVDVDVLSNDLFPSTATLTAVTLDEAENSVSHGTAAVNENKVRYTPTDMSMSDTDVFTYAVSSTTQGVADTYYGTLTVIPATTIYYEESFLTYEIWSKESGSWALTENTWAVDGTATSATQAEDRPGQASEALSSIDADNVYGYDAAYSECSTFSMGSARYVTANATTYGTATFTFYGTGFDVVSLTSNDTGTITVKVYEGTATTGSVKKQVAVDTYYGYTTDENGNWVVSNTTENALYQVPVITVEGLAYGQYTAVIKCAYNTALDHQNDGSYRFYMDAIRIYDPAGVVSGATTNDTDGVISNAYKADGEAYPVYQELRDNIIAASKVEVTENKDGSLSVTLNNGTDTSQYLDGAVFIDGSAATTSISDYVSYGPNNELYLAKSQAISFKVNLSSKSGYSIADVQLGIKSANGKNVGYTVNDESKTVSTSTDMYYSIYEYSVTSEGTAAVVTIKNTSDSILSLTNIKVTYEPDTSAQVLLASEDDTAAADPEGLIYVDEEVVSYALMSMRLDEDVEPEETEPETEATEPEVEETEPETEATEPEVEETEPEVEETEPETEPTVPEEDGSSIADTVKSIISSIISGIGKLFSKWFG